MSTPATPPPSGTPPVQLSPVNKYFVAHQRDQFHAFGYDRIIHKPQSFPSSTDFLKFLRFETNTFRPPQKTPALSMQSFIDAANVVSTSIRKDHFPNKELLEFRYTEHKALLGHITDTKCRPDITAAFSSDWSKGVTHWSCAQLAGEQASKGKTREKQEHNAISYLHYLLLARPDLYVVQGLLIDETKIKFLLGVGGCGIRQLDAPWNDTDLYRLLYAFIFSLYNPGDFADDSYTRTKADLLEETVEYTVKIRIPSADGSTSTLNCTGFCAISARNPFTTRTHVLSNPSFKEKVNGKALTVLKDQLCRPGTRFDEEMILKTIHGKGAVPGVVEAVHHETIQNRWSEVIKHRYGLRQFGLPFTSIHTPRKLLEVLFDVLEVLRYLHSECRVLHRDISAGNVLYIEDSSDNSKANLEIGGAATATAGQVPTDLPVFIKYLLRESDDWRQTSMLLIDFNRGELLNEKQASKHQRLDRNGTPLFIARAVETGKTVPLPDLVAVPGVPESPEVYASIHPDRIDRFKSAERRILEKPERNASSPWRHELDHDAESVFWLLLYWAMVVQPADLVDPPEAINPVVWASLLGQASTCDDLVGLIAQRRIRTGSAHSIYEPLGPLVQNLASILAVDRQWLTESDVRNHPAYICEAFQRLILGFILDHRQDEFMNRRVAVEFRSVKGVPNSNAISATYSEGLSAMNREALSAACSATVPTLSTTTVDTADKRALSSSMDDVKRKRRRLALAPIEGADLYPDRVECEYIGPPPTTVVLTT